MGSPADYTIILMLAAAGAALWGVLERLHRLQKDVDELKRRTEK